MLHVAGVAGTMFVAKARLPTAHACCLLMQLPGSSVCFNMVSYGETPVITQVDADEVFLPGFDDFEDLFRRALPPERDAGARVLAMSYVSFVHFECAFFLHASRLHQVTCFQCRVRNNVRNNAHEPILKTVLQFLGASDTLHGCFFTSVRSISLGCGGEQNKAL